MDARCNESGDGRTNIDRLYYIIILAWVGLTSFVSLCIGIVEGTYYYATAITYQEIFLQALIDISPLLLISSLMFLPLVFWCRKAFRDPNYGMILRNVAGACITVIAIALGTLLLIMYVVLFRVQDYPF